MGSGTRELGSAGWPKGIQMRKRTPAPTAHIEPARRTTQCLGEEERGSAWQVTSSPRLRAGLLSPRRPGGGDRPSPSDSASLGAAWRNILRAKGSLKSLCLTCPFPGCGHGGPGRGRDGTSHTVRGGKARTGRQCLQLWAS